ncbi:MAG: phosphoribosylformylglycinamidine synthase, partial [Lachnospiraceae bacterium]|nr:phosphoribosylformylglycinamidine synthase [Lachnospiraceae bacterium]
MSLVKRIYVEKKPDFAGAAASLTEDLKSYLKVEGLERVRILIRYDVENISEEIFEKACRSVFSEPPVDELYFEKIPAGESDRSGALEDLPGQFDQRADSAVQCVQFLKEDEEPVIKTAVTYILEGSISDEDFEKIKSYCINPVDSRETGEVKPETLIDVYPEPEDVKILDGFCRLEEPSLKELYDSLGLAMTFKDFQHIQNYFNKEESRDPSMTEIKVLDTYWSDHCRH